MLIIFSSNIADEALPPLRKCDINATHFYIHTENVYKIFIYILSWKIIHKYLLYHISRYVRNPSFFFRIFFQRLIRFAFLGTVIVFVGLPWISSERSVLFTVPYESVAHEKMSFSCNSRSTSAYKKGTYNRAYSSLPGTLNRCLHDIWRCQT